MSDLTRLDIEIKIEHDCLVVRLKELSRTNDSLLAESSISLEYLSLEIENANYRRKTARQIAADANRLNLD